MKFFKKKNIKRVVDKFFFVYSFEIPHIFIFFGLLWLIYFSYKDVFHGNHLDTIFIPYVTVVALNIALASVLFAYSNVCLNENKKQTKLFGETFLLVALFLIMALIINFATAEIVSYFAELKIHSIIKSILNIITGLFFGIGQSFLAFAVIFFSSALKHFEKHLFFRVRDNKLIDMDKM